MKQHPNMLICELSTFFPFPYNECFPAESHLQKSQNTLLNPVRVCNTETQLLAFKGSYLVDEKKTHYIQHIQMCCSVVMQHPESHKLTEVTVDMSCQRQQRLVLL